MDRHDLDQEALRGTIASVRGPGPIAIFRGNLMDPDSLILRSEPSIRST